MEEPRLYTVTLKITEEQKIELETFLKEKNWSDAMTEVKTDRKARKTSLKEKKLDHCVPKRRRSTFSRSHEEEQESVQELELNNQEHPQLPIEEDIRCPYCFILPCVATSNRNAHWIGGGQRECAENTSIRKRIYKRFWKIMANNGGWNIPEYVQKKIRIGGGDWVLSHRRELMPECIVNLARHLYPNPKDMPYQNHMWE